VRVLCFPDVRLRPAKWFGPSRDRGGLDHVSQELLLNITGGDRVTLARKYIEAWKGQVRAKVVLISNWPPDLGESVLPTRFVKVWLGQCFLGREDNDLKEKLRVELPGIAVRCLAAYRRLKTRGRFIQPRSASVLEEDVVEAANPYAAFVARHVVNKDGEAVTCKNVQDRFETWCRENGQIDTLKSTPKNHLTGRLQREGGLAAMRVYRPHGEARQYIGIRLRSPKELRDLDARDR
jgi:putative DNA primase/helicase